MVARPGFVPQYLQRAYGPCCPLWKVSYNLSIWQGETACEGLPPSGQPCDILFPPTLWVNLQDAVQILGRVALATVGAARATLAKMLSDAVF